MSGRKKKTQIKISNGVIVARYNPCKNQFEYLLVQKGFTYAFCDFVHKKWTLDNLLTLLNMMTTEEKRLLLEANFRKIWDHIWRGFIPKQAFYDDCERHFYRYFNGFAGRDRIRQFVDMSTSTGELLWEPPKGHRRDSKEKPLDCALREFTEETGLNFSNIKIIPGQYIQENKCDGNTVYSVKYYIGLMKKIRDFHIHTINGGGNEVRDVRWLTLPELNIICPSNHCSAMLKKASRILRSEYIV